MIPENKRWYAMPAEEVAEYFSTDLEAGLDEKEARARLKALGENEIFRIPHSSFGEHMLRISVNPLAVLLVIVCILGAFMGNVAVLALAAATIVFSYVINIMIFVKSHRVLEIMGEVSLPLATVIRDGKMVTLPQQAVVPGDIILIKAGQIVPADARLVEASKLVVIETGITEAVGSITKNAEHWDARVKKPHECVNTVYASTIVISGQAKAVVTETGKNTYVSRTKKNVSAITYEKLEMFSKLSKIAYTVSLATIFLSAVLSLINMLVPYGPGVLDGFILILAAFCCVMSEGYAVFGYLTVALGIYGTLDTKKNVNTGTLIRNIEHLDTIRDVTTLAVPVESICSNKNIKLDRVCLFDRVIDVDVDDELPEMAKQLIVKAVISTGKYTAARLLSKNTKKGKAYTVEEDAIIKCAMAHGVYNIELDSSYPIIGHADKNEAGFETTLIKWYGENRVILRGDVDRVIENCSYYKTGVSNTLSKMTPLSKSSIMTMANQMMRQSHRVIAIASGVSKYNTLTRYSELQSGLTFEGIIAFNEPVLPGAVYSIAKCREAGIKVLLFTSDVGEKNVHLARSLGIMTGDQDLEVTSTEELRVGDEIFKTNLADYKLYQGFSVADRRRIIRLLKEKGEKVAYYGRNTSEIILCREADIGVTDALTLSPRSSGKAGGLTDESEKELAIASSTYMSPTGDAMRFCSDVIVSPVSENGKGGFNALVRAVSSAKDIYIKIKRIITYLLSMNLARLFLLPVNLFARNMQMLDPVLILLSGLVFDLVMVLAIAFSGQAKDALKNKDKFSIAIINRAELIYSLICGISIGIFATAGSILLQRVFKFSSTQTESFVFVCLLLCAAVVFMEGRYKESIFKMPLAIGSIFAFNILIFSAIVALSMLIPFVGSVTGIAAFSLIGWLIALAVAAVTFGACELTKLIYKQENKYR